MEIEVANVRYMLYDGAVISIKLDLRYEESSASQAVILLKVRKRVASGDYRSCVLVLEFSGVSEINVLEKFIGGAAYSSLTLNKRDDGSYYFAIENIGDIPKPDYEYDNLKLIARFLNIWEQQPELVTS
jgi:hypothetical protein